MRNVVRLIPVLAGMLAATAVLTVLCFAVLYSPTYMFRVMVYGESDVRDWRIFPERRIIASTNPYVYAHDIDPSLENRVVQYEGTDGKRWSAPLSSVLENNGTTSFLVIRQDQIRYEAYLNGAAKDSIQTSFSSVKSIDSLLIGCAIQDGVIRGVNQKITDFLPELDGTGFQDITIRDLLTMRSCIEYKEGVAWLTDDAKTYYMPDLRRLALESLRVDPRYTGRFHYNNYHPLLLGLILERSTGQHVADYFQTRIWTKVGASDDASWSLDSMSARFEKMESGLNFRTEDFAKIGSMLLHEGTWNGQPVIDAAWIRESTISPECLEDGEGYARLLAERRVGYQYMWYSHAGTEGTDYFAAGKFGQYLYISPANQVVIVRTGTDTGEVAWWPEILRQIAGFS